jgi:hypothetical protein
VKGVGRALLAWLVLLAAMLANGFVRVLVMEPRLGEVLGRQVSTALAVSIVIVVAGTFVRGRPAASRPELLQVGAVWLLLTVAFEFLFGHYVVGATWQEQLADYDVRQGRFWPLVLVAVLVSPWVWGLARPGRPEARTSGRTG